MIGRSASDANCVRYKANGSHSDRFAAFDFADKVLQAVDDRLSECLILLFPCHMQLRFLSGTGSLLVGVRIRTPLLGNPSKLKSGAIFVSSKPSGSLRSG